MTPLAEVIKLKLKSDMNMKPVGYKFAFCRSLLAGTRAALAAPGGRVRLTVGNYTVSGQRSIIRLTGQSVYGHSLSTGASSSTHQSSQA